MDRARARIRAQQSIQADALETLGSSRVTCSPLCKQEHTDGLIWLCSPSLLQDNDILFQAMPFAHQFLAAVLAQQSETPSN